MKGVRIDYTIREGADLNEVTQAIKAFVAGIREHHPDHRAHTSPLRARCRARPHVRVGRFRGARAHRAAAALEVSSSVLRHRLARARTSMQTTYDGLCRLVSKQGVCYQCSGLREAFAPEHRGPAVPLLTEEGETPERAWRRRLAVVNGVDPDHGAAQRFHDFLWRALKQLETA